MASASPSALASRFHGDGSNGFGDDDQYDMFVEENSDLPSQVEQLPQHESATDFDLDQVFNFSTAQYIPHMAQRASAPHDLQSQMSYDLRKRKRLHWCAVCTANGGKSFKTSNDLDRHNKSVHGLLKDRDRFWMCPVNGCASASKSWTRLDNFKSHVLTMHGQQYESHINGASCLFDSQKDDPRIVTMRTRRVKSDSLDSGISIPSAHSCSQPDLAAVGNLFSGINLELSQSPPTIRMQPPRMQSGVSPTRGRGSSRVDAGSRLERSQVKDPLRPGARHQSDGSDTTPHLQLAIQRSPGREYLSPRMSSSPETAESLRSDGERSFVGMAADEDYDDISVPLSLVETQLANHIARLVYVGYQRLNAANRLPLRCHPTDENHPAGQRPYNNSRPQQSRSARLTRKRPRTTGSQGGPGDEDDDEDTHERWPKDGRQGASEGTLSPDQKTFACPYNKADAFKYSELNSEQQEYRMCGICIIKAIHALKQHLYRCHSRPKHYCPICYRKFESRNETDIHIQQQSCSRISEDPFSDKMSDDMFAKIKVKKQGDQERLWHEIFSTLFPGEPRPHSSYASDEKVVCHFFNFFVSLGPRIVQNLYQTADAAPRGTALPELTRAIVQEAYERFIGLATQQASSSAQGAPGNDEPWHPCLMPDVGSQLDPRLSSPLSPIRLAGTRHRADSGIGTESLQGPSTPNHAAVTLPSYPGDPYAMQHQYLPRSPLSRISYMQNSNFNQLDAGMLLHQAHSEPQLQHTRFDMPDLTTSDFPSTTLNPYLQPFQEFWS